MVIFVLTVVVGLMLAASSANAEKIAKFSMYNNTKCDVQDVFIDPCPEALYNNTCELPQGFNASITFKYKPKFNADAPKTRLYAVTPFLDLPFMDMDTNACLYTNCPMKVDVEQSWMYNLFVSTLYPKSTYTVKFKFWDDAPAANRSDECCFKFDIKII